MQGIFRLNGSTKRIKDLQNIFNSPDKYGKGLDWTGYTVHDAANIFRRYLNQLPEPIIPLEAYESFREPLAENYTQTDAIKRYQRLIAELPPLNRQLLLYVLDLLAVFASKAECNLMDATNLAAIFQPGLISHPTHDMEPHEYLLSQKVLVFLINHQDNFLMGMLERGRLAPEPGSSSLKHSKTLGSVARTPSNASAGADDVRRFGGIRRNVSVSSKKSGSSVPGGVSRSNTLPSKRSPRSISTPIFRPTDGSSSPRSIGTTTTVTAGQIPTRSEQTAGSMSKKRQSNSPGRKFSSAMPEKQSNPARSDPHRSLANIFSLSPTDSDKPARQPNKLRKKRIPGSSNQSAESSSTSLPVNAVHDLTLSGCVLETVPSSPPSSSHLISNMANPAPVSSSSLMPTMSPTPSATSSMTSQSSTHSDKDQKQSRSRWRWSNGKHEKWESPNSPTFPGPSSSNGSLVERIRKESRSPPVSGHRSDVIYSGSEDEEKRPFSWLAKKNQRKQSRADEHDSLLHLRQLPLSEHMPGSMVHIQPPTPMSQREEEPVGETGSSDTMTPRQSITTPDISELSSLKPGSTNITKETIKPKEFQSIRNANEAGSSTDLLPSRVDSGHAQQLDGSAQLDR